MFMIESMFLYTSYVNIYATAIAIGSSICLMYYRVRILNEDRFIVLLRLSSFLLFRSVTNLSKSGGRTVILSRDPC